MAEEPQSVKIRGSIPLHLGVYPKTTSLSLPPPSSSSSGSTCSHSVRSADGSCAHCGSCDGVFAGVTKSTTYSPSRKERSLMTKLNQYQLPDDVKKEADMLYRQSSVGTKREKNHDLLIFHFVQEAYNRLGQFITDVELANLMNVKHSDISKARSMFSTVRTGIPTSSPRRTPQEFIKSYCKTMDLSDDACSEMCCIADNIIAKNPREFSKLQKPHNVAVGIMKYYCTSNGISFTMAELVNLSMVSEATINSLYNKVSQTHNS